MSTRAVYDKSEAILDEVRQMLAGQGPQVAMAVVANLLAQFMSSHHPKVREEVREMTLKASRDLEERFIEEMVKSGSVKPEWRSEAAH